MRTSSSTVRLEPKRPILTPAFWLIFWQMMPDRAVLEGTETGPTEPQDPANHGRSGAGRDEPGQGPTAS